jgi:hypothetical protein
MANALAMYPATTLTLEGKELHLNEWEVILQAVGPEQFDRALTEHFRESAFFPTIAELRHRAGMRKADQDAVEANAAWEFISYYVYHYWHPDVGRYQGAPEIPPRTEYALRQIGGLRRLHDTPTDSIPFVCKRFMEAYRLARVDELMRPQLDAAFPAGERFDAPLKQLVGATRPSTVQSRINRPGLVAPTGPIAATETHTCSPAEGSAGIGEEIANQAPSVPKGCR